MGLKSCHHMRSCKPVITNLKGNQENLIDLRNDLVFKSFFAEKELSEFWISVESKFPQLSDKVLELLLSFGSSYLCELEFSALT